MCSTTAWDPSSAYSWSNVSIKSPHVIESSIADSLLPTMETYISTTFDDRLQSYSSAPPTPTESVAASPAPSIRELDSDTLSQPRPAVLVQSPHCTNTAWTEGLPVTGDQCKHQIGGFDESGHPSGAPLPLAPPELADEEAQPPQSSSQPSTANERTPLKSPTDPSHSPEPLRDYGATSPAPPPVRPLR